MAFLVKLMANRPNAAVHHVARRDRVCTGVAMGDRDLGQELDRDVVVHLALAHEAAVPMRGIGAQTHVRDDDELRVRLLQSPQRHLDDALIVIGPRAKLVLLGWDAEEQDGPHPSRLNL